MSPNRAYPNNDLHFFIYVSSRTGWRPTILFKESDETLQLRRLAALLFHSDNTFIKGNPLPRIYFVPNER